jgi:hypothetical protein
LDALDSDIERSLISLGHRDVVSALKAARPLWANLKLLEKGGVVEGGNVDVFRLAATMRSVNPKRYKEGKDDDMIMLGRFGEMFNQYDSTAFIPHDVVSAIVLSGPAATAAKINTSPVTTFVPRKLAGRRGAPLIAEAGETGVRGTITSIMRMLFPRLEEQE